MEALLGNVGLTGIVLIDIGIGVIFAILTFSLIASALQEAIAGLLNYRGEHLRRGILRLIRQAEIGKLVLNHPLIAGLKGPKNMVQKLAQILFMWGDAAQDTDRMPSSIPKASFARALLESLVSRRDELMAQIGDVSDQAQRAADLLGLEIDKLALDNRLKQRLKEIVSEIDFEPLKDRLADKVDAAEAAAKARIETACDQIETELAAWFDNAMDRVTGWYVRRAKTMLFILGFIMAAAVNFDLIGYGQQLARDDALRSAVVARAQAAVASGEVGSFQIDPGKVSDIARAAKDAAEPTEEQRTAERAMAYFDLNENGEIDQNEARTADQVLRAAYAVVREDTAEAIQTIREEFGDGGGTIGASFLAADLRSQIRMLLSWLILGLGCTLGGQFWFDLLKTFLRVRAGASGLNSDLETVGRRVDALRGRAGADGAKA